MQVPNTIPTGTYFIRAFVLKNSTKPGSHGLPQAQVAFGTSKGFFEVRGCPRQHVPQNPQPRGGFALVNPCSFRSVTVQPLVLSTHAGSSCTPIRPLCSWCTASMLRYGPRHCIACAKRLLRPALVRLSVGAHDRSVPVPQLSDRQGRCSKVVPINPITKGMKIAAGCCSVVGPAIFFGYFAVHAVLKKNK